MVTEDPQPALLGLGFAITWGFGLTGDSRPEFSCVAYVVQAFEALRYACAYVAQAFRPARAPKSRPKGLRYERRAEVGTEPKVPACDHRTGGEGRCEPFSRSLRLLISDGSKTLGAVQRPVRRTCPPKPWRRRKPDATGDPAHFIHSCQEVL